MSTKAKQRRRRKIVLAVVAGSILLVLGWGLLMLARFGQAGWAVLSPDKQYLVVFQNEAELRPTGGFIGAYAVIKTGLPPSIEIKDSYELEQHEPETAPEPVNTLLDDGEWYGGHFFRDANISPDWPTSAAELMRMYNLNFEQETEFNGVFAVNFGAVEKLLAATGPVNIGGRELSSVNAFYTLEVLLRPTDAHDTVALQVRKNALKTLANQMLTKLAQPWKWQGITNSLVNALNEKDIVLYFTEAEVQREVSEWGWSGELKAESGSDFLAINIANYGGKKSDRYIDKRVDYNVEIDANGQAEATLTLQLKHREKETLFTGDWFGWVRVYVPQGSKLLTEDEMTESYTESGLQVFSQVVSLPRGTSQTLSYRYQLPGKFEDEYALKVWKQPGAVMYLQTDVRTPTQNFWQSSGFQVKENHARWDGWVEEDLNLRGSILLDTIAPFVTNQHVSDLQTVWVDVSEPLALGRSIISANYSIEDLDKTNTKHDTVEVLAAEHFGNIIKLTISGMTEQFEERYALTIKNQEDKSGNKMGDTRVTIVQRLGGEGLAD